MEKETLKNIMHFLEKEDNKSSVKWKLLNKEPFTEEDLDVRGDLNLGQTIITSLPKGLKVGGYLSLVFTKITSLPEGLVVGKNLDLYGSKIESLPKGLEVGWHLDLAHSNIKLLPKGLKVGGALYIYKSPLKEYTDDELREMIYPGFIKGKIYR
jgi:hypothetical protein